MRIHNQNNSSFRNAEGVFGIYSVIKMLTFVSMTIVLSGCFDLDSSLFNNDILTSYNLRTTVIPESLRTQVVLTSQGKKIYGYFVKSSNAVEKNIILYNHGNRDHLQFYWDRVELFYKMGYNVFIYDYRGYGMSEGEPTEEAIYSDANAAYYYLHSRGFSDGQITVYGFSLGGAPATHLAANTFTPKRLILEAAFASASTLTQSGTLLELPGSFVMKGEYNNAERIKRVTSPVLILHGIDDKFIDMEKNGKVIYRNANDPKKFIAIPGADHSEVPWKMGEAMYILEIKNFISN
jgi:alpha-beta hydrolase superfamily lysophospholipase